MGTPMVWTLERSGAPPFDMPSAVHQKFSPPQIALTKTSEFGAGLVTASCVRVLILPRKTMEVQ